MTDNTPSAEQQQQRSWIANAGAWTTAVREGQIASRRLGTDAAIIEACAVTPGTTVLDVGCGEGWLARALDARGAVVTGVDGSAPLIDAARALGGAQFHVADYQLLATSARHAGPFDLIVCNFALLDEVLTPLLVGLRDRLALHGRVVVQTVHPFAAAGEPGYVDGWREERFVGFGDGFESAMPWYYRTFAAWHRAFADAGLVVRRLEEPRRADGTVLSLIMQLTRG
jgi:2-polyprenyl-3-methyl-5-hydroxy-6-metoxy-1,4-benzoquinol methylase